MKSTTAHNLAKAEQMNRNETRTLKQRAGALHANQQHVRLASLSSPIPAMHTQDTDYTPSPNIAAMPLKLREKSRITNWPVPPRQPIISELPPERNVGKLFRRFADGTLCYDDVIPKLKRIVDRYNKGIAELNETDAIMLSAVFPEVRFRYLSESVVNLKAPLADRERTNIRRRLPICPA